MIRKFVTLDGEVLEETEWQLRPIDICFHCDLPLINSVDARCTGSQDEEHDFITLCHPSER